MRPSKVMAAESRHSSTAAWMSSQIRFSLSATSSKPAERLFGRFALVVEKCPHDAPIGAYSICIKSLSIYPAQLLNCSTTNPYSQQLTLRDQSLVNHLNNQSLAFRKLLYSAHQRLAVAQEALSEGLLDHSLETLSQVTLASTSTIS